MKEVRVCWCVSEMPPTIQTTQTSSHPTPASTHTTLYSFKHYLLTKDIHTTKDALMYHPTIYITHFLIVTMFDVHSISFVDFISTIYYLSIPSH